MKSITKPRYRVTKEYRAKAAERLIKAMCIDEFHYNEVIFHYGTALLQVYFTDALQGDEGIRRLYHHMLRNKKYWTFFMNQRDQAQIGFSSSIQEKHKLDVNDFGRRKAATILYSHWIDMHEEFIRDPDIFERIRHFIIQNYQSFRYGTGNRVREKAESA